MEVTDMDLTYFKTFLEVAKWQNFTRAADSLGYAQSSVTAQIQKLEAAYGIPLFERIGKKIILTKSGEELHRYALKLVELYEESKVTLARASTGSFTLGTFEVTLASYILPAILQQCKEKFPDVTIVYQHVGLNDLLRAIKANECDLGFMVDRKQSDPDLVFEIVREEEYVLIASPRHPLARMNTVMPQQLDDQDIIFSVPGCVCRQLLENLLETNHVRYRVVSEIYSLEAVKACVMNGLGISLVPKTLVAHECRRGELVTLPLVHPPLRLFIQIVYHKKKHITVPMRYFIDSLMSAKVSIPHPS
jgi:DNA-binding transcriptional LysR family regulator